MMLAMKMALRMDVFMGWSKVELLEERKALKCGKSWDFMKALRQRGRQFTRNKVEQMSLYTSPSPALETLANHTT